MSRLARFQDLTETKAALSITGNAEEMSTEATPSLRITSDAKYTTPCLIEKSLEMS